MYSMPYGNLHAENWKHDGYGMCRYDGGGAAVM